MIQMSKMMIDGVSVNSVSARDVWKFVESKRHFADWIKARISRGAEGVDFVVHVNVTQYNQVDTKEYYLTVDYAKAVCMMEDNAKGDELRRYFVECEKIAVSVSQSSSPLALAGLMLQALQEQEKRLVAIETTQSQQQAINEDQCLTSTQIGEIEDLFSKYFVHVGRDGKKLGQLKKLIKCKFLTPPISGKTYKDAASGRFPEIVAEIKQAMELYLVL